MNDLTKALRSIANPLRQPPGPSTWDTITEADFGKDFDFELYPHGDTTVFYPVSKAALQWGYRFLQADLDRWHGVGFVIESEFIDLVARQARHDKLVSLDDALHEEQERQRQGQAND